MKKKFFLLCLAISNYSYADQFREIRLKNFNIVFPTQIEQEMPMFCSDVDVMCDAVFKDFGKTKKFKIQITNTSIRNAFVSPYKYFPWSKVKIYFINYNFLLENYTTIFIHEMRHVAQFAHFVDFYKTPVKLLSFLTFDTVMFMEGDAVLTETLLTNEGRGRDPHFLLTEKIRILNDANIKYADFLFKNWYTLGYLFCTHFREKYGYENFKKLFERNNLSDGLSWRKGYKNFRIFVDNVIDRFYPFSITHRLKRLTGRNIPQFFSDVKAEAKEKWSKQLENLKITDFEKVNKENKSYINPQKFKDGIIAWKTSRVEPKMSSEFSHFVFFKDGKEEKIKEFDFYFFSSNFSCAQNKILFSGKKKIYKNSKVTNYLQEGENAIFILDDKGKVEIIDQFPHCRKPVFSHDATKILFLSYDTDATPLLVVLEAKSFKVIQKYTLEKFHDYANLIFSHDDENIFFIDNYKGEGRIKVIENGNIKEVYKSKASVWRIDENEKFIFFESPLSGIDNIYAFEKKSQQVWQVTSSKYGAYKPHVIDDFLVYNDYNFKCCYDIAKVKIDKNNWIPIEQVEDRNVYFFESPKNEKIFTLDEKRNFDHLEAKNYKMSHFRGFILNKHSKKTKKFSADFLQNEVINGIYDRWLGVNFYDYNSGFSWGGKYKTNEKNNLFNVNIGYFFLDMHEVVFDTTVFTKTKDDKKFFNDNTLSYNFISEKFIGKNLFKFKPEVMLNLKKKKESWDFKYLFDINFDFEMLYSSNTTFFAIEKQNAFLIHTFKYSINRRNSFNIGVYGFIIDKENVKKNSNLFKILGNNKVTLGVEKKRLPKKAEKESLEKFYQIGFSVGYIFSIPLNYSLENWSDELYEFWVRGIKICPELKVDLSMFSKNEYSLLCNVDFNIFKNTILHTKTGVKFDGDKVSLVPFGVSIDLNLVSI